MQRVQVDFISIRHFDDLSQVHDRHPIADMANHTEVVGDKEIRQPKLFLQVFEQVYYLRLDGDI